MVECVVYSEHFAEHIEHSQGQQRLQDAYQVVAQRPTAYLLILLDSLQGLFCHPLGLKYRDDARAHTVEHTCADVVWSDGGNVHIAPRLLHLDTQ